MVKQIISAYQAQTKGLLIKDSNNFLNVSEFYCDTIQGEGINIGQPAAFLRLKNCVLNCQYCDSKEVWRYGSAYTFNELFDLIDAADLPRKLFEGQHLVLTGGSPLHQQENLYRFMVDFFTRYNFYPYVEIENECVIYPNMLKILFVDCWNNSPKLSSSGIPKNQRYKPKVIQRISKLMNSWFKFVVDCEEDWEEILMDFIEPAYIRKDQIILMPEGATREELEKTRPIAVEMATKHNVRFTDRLHVTLWNKKVGT